VVAHNFSIVSLLSFIFISYENKLMIASQKPYDKRLKLKSTTAIKILKIVSSILIWL
jgi:hypothetical protein